MFFHCARVLVFLEANSMRHWLLGFFGNSLSAELGVWWRTSGLKWSTLRQINQHFYMICRFVYLRNLPGTCLSFVFWGLNPPKGGLVQSNQGFIWVPGMYYVAPLAFEGTFSMTLEVVKSGNGWTLRCANNGWMDCLRLEAAHLEIECQGQRMIWNLFATFKVVRDSKIYRVC